MSWTSSWTTSSGGWDRSSAWESGGVICDWSIWLLLGARRDADRQSAAIEMVRRVQIHHLPATGLSSSRPGTGGKSALQQL